MVQMDDHRRNTLLMIEKVGSMVESEDEAHVYAIVSTFKIADHFQRLLNADYSMEPIDQDVRLHLAPRMHKLATESKKKVRLQPIPCICLQFKDLEQVHMSHHASSAILNMISS